jgi:hypothetical protein
MPEEIYLSVNQSFFNCFYVYYVRNLAFQSFDYEHTL